MTFTTAAFVGMGLVVVFGLGALGLAYWSAPTRHRDDTTNAP